jgi:hypothetical protein
MAICKYCEVEFVPKRSTSQYCKQSCGNNFRARKFRASTGQTKEFKDRTNKYRSSPKERYLVQRNQAKNRGIDFNLTFDEWWKLWEPYWAERGKGKLVMCRTLDCGPYEVGNVRIDTHQSNMQEWQDIRRSQNG